MAQLFVLCGSVITGVGAFVIIVMFSALYYSPVREKIYAGVLY